MNPESKHMARAALFFSLFALLLVYLVAATSAVPAYGAAGPSCTDSDGGREYGVAGYVQGIGPQGYEYLKADECQTGEWAGYLKEFFCSDTTPWPERYRCANGCADGACIGMGPTLSGTLTPTLTPGLTPTLPARAGTALVQEACPGDEELCDNGVDDDCNRLADGQDPACGLCADTDGGPNYFAAGEVTVLDGKPVADRCASAGELIEYQCAIDGTAQKLTYTCPTRCAAGACEAPNLVIIGWDGTQWDHLQECFTGEGDGCESGMPNLKELSGGILYPSVTSSGGTATKPGWAQLMSGYDAEVTGITTNSEYQPLPEGYSIFEKLENRFGADSIVTMFVSAKGEHTGGACVGEMAWHRAEQSPEEIGQPWCLTKEHLDYWENDLRQNDQVGTRALELLEAHQDDLFVALFLFREPDVVAHVVGENAFRYSASLVELDGWLGTITDKIEELGLSERTLVWVVTDHGIDEGKSRHNNAPYGFFASNDPLIVRPGDRKDVAATILDRYGIGLEAIGDAPPVDGYSLYAIPSLDCIPAGEPFLKYEGAPVCCEGLDVLPRQIKLGAECIEPTGGTGIVAGYCADCGNGTCDAEENRCNCPDDCGAVITNPNPGSNARPAAGKPEAPQSPAPSSRWPRAPR